MKKSGKPVAVADAPFIADPNHEAAGAPAKPLEDTVLAHVAVSEGEEFIEATDEPEAEDALALPQQSYPCLVPEIGISPVALLTRTFAEDAPEWDGGNACHVYRSLIFNGDGTVAAHSEVSFHKGALSTAPGPNGIADTTLLSILAHRWNQFQNGPFPSEHTEQALEHVLAAIDCLNNRTRERTERGVQGEHKQ